MCEAENVRMTYLDSKELKDSKGLLDPRFFEPRNDRSNQKQLHTSRSCSWGCSGIRLSRSARSNLEIERKIKTTTPIRESNTHLMWPSNYKARVHSYTLSPTPHICCRAEAHYQNILVLFEGKLELVVRRELQNLVSLPSLLHTE